MHESEQSNDLSAALAPILSGIAEFFNLFDMSFFVSGATVAGAIGYWLWLGQRLVEPNGVAGIGALIVACYVLGLLAFSLGRSFRRKYAQSRGRTRSSYFLNQLEKYGEACETPVITQAKSAGSLSEETYDAAYAYMWAILRQCPKCRYSVKFTNRYWVMAATYDGLAIAMVAWALVLGYQNVTEERFMINESVAAVVLLLIAVNCFKRAATYDLHQIAELISSYAAHKAKHWP